MHRLVTIGRDEEALAVYQTLKPRDDAASDAKAGRVLIRTMVIRPNKIYSPVRVTW